MRSKHPTSRNERLRINEFKKAEKSKDSRVIKARKKLVTEFLKDKETEDELKEFIQDTGHPGLL